PDTARLTEINTAGQLAHNEDVEASHHFRLERRSVSQLRIEDGWPQVAEQIEFGAELEQPFLRTDGAIQLVPLRAADGAEQDGIGRARLLQRLVRQRYAGRIDGGA